ncbi:hypothetical protein KP509_23G082000 [Ceratopteris richardii]|nr:hypothetical protein KP509_23G082000 [Ceratopteris richardii]
MLDVPFEELQRARSDGSCSFRPEHGKKAVSKRANKNRPVEISSKKPVSRFREVIQAPKKIVRDPRFENLCGSYEESKFKASYKFLYDEQLPAERKRLQILLQKEKSDAAIAELKKHISWIDKQLRDEQLRRKHSQKLTELKRMEKEAVKKGKRPFYIKKSEIRKQELAEKFKELKGSGKLEAFLAKRHRRNAAKDHRFMPYRRSQTS